MDEVLHAERLVGRAKRLHRRNIDELPDGAFAAFDGAAFAIRAYTLLHWTPEGYGTREPRPQCIAADVRTLPAILAVLSAGYQPRWRLSAKD
jgi:hypothetical protein